VATIASIADVRNAGNYSGKVREDSLTFYLNLSSFFLKEMIGQENYEKAVSGSLPGDDNEKLKIVEALMAVGFSLPAIATVVAETGALRTVSVGGRGGELEVVSFSREITLLASHFFNLAHLIIPSVYIVSENYEQIWHDVIQRVFPGLDETPTVAPIHSYAEGVIKEARGDERF